MKRMRIFCLTAALLMLLCACGAGTQSEETQSPYDALISRLEAGDYDGARAMIDAMEGQTAPAETEAPETHMPAAQPESVIYADIEIVELNQYNARDYFEFREEFLIGQQSHCTQYIALKEEYRDRLLSVEDVLLQVSCLRCEAYGTIDLEEEEFRPEYYEPTSREKEVRVLELENTGSGWLTGMTVFSDRGYFPDYAMDVEIISGSGKLVFSVE